MTGGALKLLVAGTDATQLTQSCAWAGSAGQVGRTLDFSLLSSPMDRRLPVVKCDLGSPVQLFLDGTLLFDGFVFSRQKDTGSSTIDVGCFDRGIYLKRNEAQYLFTNQTPEAITGQICGEFGIATGELAVTGVKISRNFPGVSLYQIVQTAYTMASASTGAKYQIRFRGVALDVVEKKKKPETPVLLAGSNLINATVTESTESMVNQVVVYDDNGKLRSTKQDENAVALYGLMQSVLKKSKDKDMATEAKRLLEDSGVSQKISVENLGNPTLITGSCCVLREPCTGLYGLFWIDGDSHTWKNGLYQNKLTLNFRNLMDEQEAGQQPKA